MKRPVYDLSIGVPPSGLRPTALGCLFFYSIKYAVRWSETRRRQVPTGEERLLLCNRNPIRCAPKEQPVYSNGIIRTIQAPQEPPKLRLIKKFKKVFIFKLYIKFLKQCCILLPECCFFMMSFLVIYVFYYIVDMRM